jgi:DNA-binding response OmpR family regulator
MRILVVEDEKDLNRILVKRLRLEGYAVWTWSVRSERHIRTLPF